MHYLVIALLFTHGSSGHARPTIEIHEDDIIIMPEQQGFFEGYPESRVVKSRSEYYWKGSTLVYSFGGGLCK